MISRLKGTLEEKLEGRAVVDVQGVGYGLLLPETVVRKLPEIGQPVTLQVYTHVREDQLTLFGFASHLEREVFELLMSASGVGPKVALSILSALEAEQILRGVVNNDKALFNGISGVGKKTVEKLFVEIREKAEKRLLAEKGAGRVSAVPREEAGVASWASDLESALLALGYREADLNAVLREVATRLDASAGFDAALRMALQFLSAGANKGVRGNA